MTTAHLIDIIFIAVVFSAVLYWIFVSPVRARKRRHEEMHGQGGQQFRSWDPNIAARKRDR
ncbi:MAG: hypothetical protein ABI630_05880 [Betaproteobacteria bacterium]